MDLPTVPVECCYCGLLVKVQLEVEKWTQASAWLLVVPKASVWQHVTSWEEGEMEFTSNGTTVIPLQWPDWYWTLKEQYVRILVEN